MQHKKEWFVFSLALCSFLGILFLGSQPHAVDASPANASENEEKYVYAPMIFKPIPTATPTLPPTPTAAPTATPTVSPTATPVWAEFRGMWVTRFDWTSGTAPADPAKIDEIVGNAAYAGINAIFFQVRANGDAYYAPGLEPWAKRVSGVYGQAPSPAWDPLAYFISKAHAQGIQLHAYLNIYPVWDDCDEAPNANVWPRPLYWGLRDAHGVTAGKLHGLQWTQSGDVHCSGYVRAAPSSAYFDDHLLAVVSDLVTRYDIDGIHLDHIRYGGNTTSCDPVSQAASGVSCFSAAPSGYASYQDWQRAQVNGTVSKLYHHAVNLDPSVMVSAAVWPVYVDYWGWGASEGYHDYFQDSKSWILDDYIDMISPMIYPGSVNCPDDSFFNQSRWTTLAHNFNQSSGGRFVTPGIGTAYCSFSEISARISAARNAGTAGHALFSYSGLKSRGYFDDLRNGPYSVPARVPEISWR